MTQAEHEKRLRKIEAETEPIKREMMQFEFQHKKDMAEADRRFNARAERIDLQIDHIGKKIDHLVSLVGLTYDELDSIDAILTETGEILTRPRKRARIK